MYLRLLSRLFAMSVASMGLFPQIALAGGGICLMHAQPFTLRSDTVRWSTIIIDNISIVEPPKFGRLVIQGPAFRYFSSADAQGPDSFKIAISGTSLHVIGTSSIEVDVTSQ